MKPISLSNPLSSAVVCAGITFCLCFIVIANPIRAAESGHLTYTALGSDRTADYKIVNQGEVFARDTPKIVCVWRGKGIASGTVLKGVWIAEDVGNAAPPNYKIVDKSITIQVENEGSLNVTKPTNGWPVGKYRLEIYLNDTLVKTLPFTIKAK
jgi:hypothetical protein